MKNKIYYYYIIYLLLCRVKYVDLKVIQIILISLNNHNIYFEFKKKLDGCGREDIFNAIKMVFLDNQVRYF